jgi:putative nucleotidyltransferase with HDIG domain
VIAGLPLILVFSLGSRLGAIATVISMGLSIGLAQLGNALWQRHPGSKDVVFNDLMLWGYFRRIRTRKGLSKKVERLGIGSGKVQGRDLSLDEQTRLLKRLAIALESGDPYTHGHSQRVARHSYMIAKAMKLPRAEREKIRLAAIVHDVGKLRIPKDIINKPGALTDAQYDIIKTHSLVGAKMVSILNDPELTRMVRQHHERLDGSGYPDKLRGDDICLGARILAVADTFDATSSQRPYRAAQPHKVSIDILKSEAGRKLDRKVVDAFVDYYSGKRSFKWWAFAAVVPAHLRDLSILLAQRVGAAGIANAAVVGATAVALTPGPVARPVVKFDGSRNNRPVAVAASVERSRTGHGAPGDSVLGDKVAKHNGKRHGKRNGQDRHLAAVGLGRGRDRGRNEGANGNGNGHGNENNNGHGNENEHGNGQGSLPAPGEASVGGDKPKDEKPDKNDMPTTPPGQQTPSDGTDGGSSDGGGSNSGSGSSNSGSGNNSGNGNGGGKKEEPAPTEPAPDDGGSGDSGSGDSGSGDSGSGSGDSGSGGGEPAPEEPTGPGNSGNAPGQGKDKDGDTGGGGGNGGGNGGGKDKRRA